MFDQLTSISNISHACSTGMIFDVCNGLVKQLTSCKSDAHCVQCKHCEQLKPPNLSGQE